jgi:Zn-dependent metalloprotease
MAKKNPRGTKALGNNGLKSFSLHSNNAASRPALAQLSAEREGHPAFALTAPADVQTLDPETVARRYLEQALQSPTVPQLTAPKVDDTTSEFKSLGSESIPLTGTTTVKFRQTVNNMPVYGSLVTVELDEGNKLLGINSALGTPKGVSPIAKISASDAVKAVEKYPGHKKNLQGIVPRLSYYFDTAQSKWRLVFILEDVPVVSEEKVRSPFLMDYVVDAHTGKVVIALPRTPTAADQGTAIDGLGNSRTFEVDKNGSTALLKDTTLNLQTFDFKFKDPSARSDLLPGRPIKSPPQFAPAAVSAHANAAVVSSFLRNVLKRNNIDNQGGVMRSSINCVDMSESPDGKEWLNAFWNGDQMVYGQRKVGNGFLSLAIALEVVGHEMFHGVTDRTARLEYALQPGALNESYSDIFGIIIANHPNPDPRTWKWEIGAGLQTDGQPFRDMADPTRFGQPDHMRDFKNLPNTRPGDYGGVHTNSGIHNKAAFSVLTAVKGGALVFTPAEVAGIFYLALTQRLSRTSQFADSRTAVLDSARTLLRNLTPNALDKKIAAIEAGFDAVGIE